MTTAENGWWSELDDQVLTCLREGPISTGDLARRLNLSPAGATSVLLMLAAEGKIRHERRAGWLNMGGPDMAPHTPQRSGRPGEAVASLDHPRAHRLTAVPPTVISSIRIVGSPTPTGTDWPSLPQVPTPSSSARS